jgi:thiol-disulfide isomerase/thioredoxin
MNKSFLILILFLAPLFSRAQENDPSTLIKTGNKAPTFDFYIKKDQKANLKDYRGKIVMINFFATWCGPCAMELPLVQKNIWDKYKDNPQFALMIFGREEGWDKVSGYKETHKYTMPFLPDEGRKIFSLYATQSIPRNVIIDEKGKIIYQSIGYSPDEFKQLVKLLDSKLKSVN